MTIQYKKETENSSLSCNKLSKSHFVKSSRRSMKNTAPTLYVEAYLFYPNLHWLETRGKCQYLFKQSFDEIDSRICDHPLFLNQQSAFQYSRFMGTKHAILKAYVPEYSIEGHNHHLVLKKGIISSNNIQGCFLSSNKCKVFYQNPDFDLSLSTN